MPWKLTASGHSPDPTCEAWVLDRVTDILAGAEAGLRHLCFDSEHHGEVTIDQQAAATLRGEDFLPEPGVDTGEPA
jgi:hypothetical protein